MKRITLFVSALLITFSTTIYAQKTWTGTTSTAWNTSTNWSPAGAPASTDDVIVPSAPANQPLISGTSTPVCKNLSINSGATLTISGTTLNNGSLTASGNAVINGALSIGGSITKTGKLVVVNITWASTATMSGYINGGIDVSGNWEFSTGSAISMGFCSVNFTGSTNTQIISKSAGSSFYAVTINKNSGNTVDIASTSTATLNFGNTVTINAGSTLLCHSTNSIVFSNNLYNTGHFSFSTGTVSFEKTSGTQIIQVNSGDFFNNMIINSGGTVTINNYLTVFNDLTINSGIFDPLGNIVVLFGDWDNNVGPDSFTEGTSRVIFSGGNYHQYSSTENFNILEVNKSIGGAFRVNTGTVTCNQYDWTAGAIDVLNNGTFTALDLADQGIRGNYYVNIGCTINLYQDASQYVDLGGNLTFTSGGTINVYGGNGTVSQWPTYANASITMDGGILDFKDQSITINTLSGYTLTTNVTGGIIRTSRSFFNNRTDFNPTGGTVELYGSVNSGIDFINGSVWNLEIDKDVASSVTLNTNLTINNNLTVNSGTITYVNKVLTLANTLNINSGGVFNLGMAGQLKLASGKYLNVNSGGLLKTEGTGADNAIITHSAGYYFISVKNGGTISAKYTYFQYLNYVQLMSGSTLNPANAFYRCTFTNNSAAPSGAVLSFANDQVVSIHEANFVALNSGYNVLKSNDAGHVYFKDATGSYAGATYENDPYNRIDWVASTPGLWTGVASSDWYNQSNWDDYNVPVASTNVTISGVTANQPVIGAGNAYCKNLSIQTDALLIQNDGGYFYVSGNFVSYPGQFIMNGASYLYFTGSYNTSWHISPVENANNYTNIRLLKDMANDTVVLSGRLTCTGTFEIREGTLDIDWGSNVEITNTGTSALEVENGGCLTLSYQAWLYVEGSIHFFDESCAIINYPVTCGKDFIMDATATVEFTPSYGSLMMDGAGTQHINNLAGENLILNILSINKPGGVCYIQSNDLKVNGKLYIFNGTLSCNNGPTPTATYNIYVNKEWRNEVGPSGFDESSGRVIFWGPDIGYLNWGETFNILEVDKGSQSLEVRAEVTCAVYDWTSGSIKTFDGGVYYDGGIFTANDLFDNAIKGSFICEEGGIMNLTNSGTGTFVDLAGELHNFGGTINISGSISYWPYGGNAVVEMTGGVIDLKNCGLNIYNTGTYSLNYNITGGTIRTAYGFAGNRSDFTPGAGTFEFYGSSNATISQSNGSSLYDMVINKSAKQEDKSSSSEPIFDERSGIMVSDGGKSNLLTLNSNLLIKGDLSIQSGQLSAEDYTIYIKGDWNNLVGPDGFIEGTGRVVFNHLSSDYQSCSSETFNILEIDKEYANLLIEQGTSISCQVYDWTSGGLKLFYSSFYAADLADNGVYGDFDVRASTIELHQDPAQGVDFIGNIFILDSEFKVYGGNDQSNWGTNGNANLRMWGGTLDFVDQGINIQEVAPYTFTSHYDEEGVIRTQKLFAIHQPGDAIWTVELYGNQNGMVAIDNGASVYNLKISKPQLPVFTNLLSSNIGGGLFIQHGTTIVEAGNTVQCGYMEVDNGGDFRLASATLKVGWANVVVDSGGYFYTEGNEAAKSKITTVDPDESYGFWLNSGAFILANNTIFENLDYPGISIPLGATVMPYQPFKNCEFINGGNGSNVYTLFINNDQDLVIENAVFSLMDWDDHNVSKWNDAGSVTMVNASGPYAGPAFEYDLYNRIFWEGFTNYLDLKVWLEGPFNNTEMNTNLTGLTNFPLNQPYNVYPWNYAGTESVVTVPGNVVDWVLVELRDAPSAAAATSATRIARMAAFLKKDGSIVGMNGTSLLEFSNSITNQLYVVIWHRNHIEIMSAIPLVKVGETYAYDFRTDVTKAYGAGVGYKDLGAGVAVMVGADGNADGNINNFDKIGQWNPNAGKKGYLSADFNMDSQVNNIDKNNYWWPNMDEGFNSQVPE